MGKHKKIKKRHPPKKREAPVVVVSQESPPAMIYRTPSLVWTLSRHTPQILTFVIIAFIAGTILFLSRYEKKDSEFEATAKLIVKNNSKLLDENYPGGYKIIVYKNKKWISTDVNTLPKDLKINWNDVVVSILPANAYEGIPEKIHIDIPEIKCPSFNVSYANVSGTFTRQRARRSSLADFDGNNFFVELIEDDGETMYLLFGIG